MTLDPVPDGTAIAVSWYRSRRSRSAPAWDAVAQRVAEETSDRFAVLAVLAAPARGALPLRSAGSTSASVTPQAPRLTELAEWLAMRTLFVDRGKQLDRLATALGDARGGTRVHRHAGWGPGYRQDGVGADVRGSAIAEGVIALLGATFEGEWQPVSVAKPPPMAPIRTPRSQGQPRSRM